MQWVFVLIVMFSLFLEKAYAATIPMAVVASVCPSRGGGSLDDREGEDHSDLSDEYDIDDEVIPDEGRPRQSRPKSTSSPPKPSWAQRSLQLTGKVVAGTVTRSGKLAFHLWRPKDVDGKEIVGLWRLDQQLNDGLSSAATVELTRDGFVRMGEEPETSYEFVRRSWPKACKVEFVARAFSVEGRPPIRFFYKAYLYRKMADKSVIKMQGKIFQIEKAGWRGKRVEYIQVGTFTGRRRLQLEEEGDLLDDDDDDDDDWDEGDEEDEWEVDENVEKHDDDDGYDEEWEDN